jgi:hypothetical protein
MTFSCEVSLRFKGVKFKGLGRRNAGILNSAKSIDTTHLIHMLVVVVVTMASVPSLIPTSPTLKPSHLGSLVAATQ